MYLSIRSDQIRCTCRELSFVWYNELSSNNTTVSLWRSQRQLSFEWSHLKICVKFKFKFKICVKDSVNIIVLSGQHRRTYFRMLKIEKKFLPRKLLTNLNFNRSSRNWKFCWQMCRLLMFVWCSFFSSDGGSEVIFKKGEAVKVVNSSQKRGYLVVEHRNGTCHVPFQYMELKVI